MADADADTRPNVLLVLTDQERYDAKAHPRVPDRNAGDRSALERGRPLRAGGHTDQYLLERSRVVTDRPVPHGHGMLNNCHEPDAIRANLPADLSTFSEELVAAGYDLTYTGKWHAGRDQTPPISGSRISGQRQTPRRHRRGVPRVPRGARRPGWRGRPRGGDLHRRGAARRQRGDVRRRKTSVDVEGTRAYFLAERTIDAIESHADGDRDGPFFHRTDFYGPHHPYVVPEPYASMYDPDEIEPPRATPRPTTGSHRSTRTTSPTAASPASTGISGPKPSRSTGVHHADRSPARADPRDPRESGTGR